MSHSSFHRIASWLLVPIAALLVAAGLGLVAASPAQALPRLPQCANNIDDDNDGKVDYPFDSQCSAPGDVRELGGAVRVCSNNVDDDGDGKKDFPADPGCGSAWDASEADLPAPALPPACANGKDDDGDGRIDFQAPPLGVPDPGCSWAAETSEADTACSDGIDNDGDGYIDWPLDFGCTTTSVTALGVNDTNEADPPQCDDGRDNDGDGLLDFLPAATRDPDCDSATDPLEAPSPQPPPPAGRLARCADGIDNDGDGRIDYPADGGCSSAADDDETDPAVRFVRCADGIDNDGDGKIDYPADPGCSSTADDDETNATGPVGPSNVPLRLLAPFPIVRLRGRSDRSGVRISLLTVRAPAGSTVSVYCTGRSCPRKKVWVRAGTKTVRVRRFERRLRAGTVLKIYVTKPGFVGKYTRFRFVRTRAPSRADSCATTAGARPRACPSS